MYFDTHIEYKNQVMTDLIENEMQRHKETCMQAISRIAHFEKEALSKILAYSAIEENEDAVRLADKLNLGKLDFFAILDDYESFKELYLKDQEYSNEQDIAQNF